jgi:hypothetical protein
MLKIPWLLGLTTSFDVLKFLPLAMKSLMFKHWLSENGWGKGTGNEL